MATSVKRSHTAKKPEPAPSTTQAQAQTTNGNDAKLLTFIRSHSERIASGMSSLASRAGEQRNWGEMNEYLTIANQLLALTGLNQPATPLAMGKGAGR